MTGIQFSSPIIAYSGQTRSHNSGTTMPESGTSPSSFANTIKAYPGQLKVEDQSV